MMLNFSVVIPVFNKEVYLKETILSVLNQTYSNFELIAVNDGSTDDSLKILEAFKDERITIISQSNQGVSAARNRGIEAAQHEHIALLDADDLWINSHLKQHANNINQYPEAAIYANNYKLRLSDNVEKSTHFSNFSPDKNIQEVDNYFKFSLKDNLVWTSAVCFKKSHFKALGKFNLDYKTGQDLDLWIRFALHYPVIFNLNPTMIYKKGIINSLSKQEYNQIRLQLFTSFLEEEKANKHLQKYLDLKRYGLALRSKAGGEFEIYSKAKSYLSQDNLSFKQKFLLSLPKFVLKPLHQLRDLLLQKDWFLRRFK